MKRLNPIVFLALLTLSACTTPKTTAAPQSGNNSSAAATATSAPANTAYPAVAAAPATAYPAGTPTGGAAASGATGATTTFKIVPNESKASYTVNETLFNENNRINTAIGTTPQITGDIIADKANPQNSKLGTITVDLSQLTSDSSRRDNFIKQQFLESSKFPLATFVPDKIDGIPSSYKEGQDYSLKISGNLTVHNVTKPVTFDVTANLKGDTLTGTATTNLLMSDFGVGPISLMNMLKTEDKVIVKISFVARP